MNDAEYLQLIQRLKRQFPRNAELLVLFDEAERRVTDRGYVASLDARTVTNVTKDTPSNGHVTMVTVVTPKRDRAAYMREWRARQG